MCWDQLVVSVDHDVSHLALLLLQSAPLEVRRPIPLCNYCASAFLKPCGLHCYHLSCWIWALCHHQFLHGFLTFLDRSGGYRLRQDNRQIAFGKDPNSEI